MTSASFTARSVVVPRQGGAEVLEVQDRAIAAPGPDRALVEVRAAGVNFIDIYQRNGTHDMDFPFVAGLEGAGTIKAVGKGVSDFTVGDRVAWASVPGSGYTTHANIAASALVKIPDTVNFEQAAAVMLQGLTAQDRK